MKDKILEFKGKKEGFIDRPIGDRESYDYVVNLYMNQGSCVKSGDFYIGKVQRKDGKVFSVGDKVSLNHYLPFVRGKNLTIKEFIQFTETFMATFNETEPGFMSMIGNLSHISIPENTGVVERKSYHLMRLLAQVMSDFKAGRPHMFSVETETEPACICTMPDTCNMMSVGGEEKPVLEIGSVTNYGKVEDIYEADQEIVGTKIKPGDTMISFENSNKLYRLQEIKDIEVYKKLFTTDDGEDIYRRDQSIFWVSTDDFKGYAGVASALANSGIKVKRFSKKENLMDYLAKNKPVLSFKDVSDWYAGNNASFPNLLSIAKSKLKEVRND